MKISGKRLFFCIMLLSAVFCASAQETPTDSLPPKPKEDLMHRIGSFFTKYFKDFNETDTSFIEPQHYNYAFMMQNTNTYETYRLRSKSGQSIMFAPKPTYRIGPYFGWRWIFLGYTFDISHITNTKNKKEFDIASTVTSCALTYTIGRRAPTIR